MRNRKYELCDIIRDPCQGLSTLASIFYLFFKRAPMFGDAVWKRLMNLINLFSHDNGAKGVLTLTFFISRIQMRSTIDTHIHITIKHTHKDAKKEAMPEWNEVTKSWKIIIKTKGIQKFINERSDEGGSFQKFSN